MSVFSSIFPCHSTLQAYNVQSYNLVVFNLGYAKTSWGYVKLK
jgi:hypothetical protein